jgi:hypothetical protein
MNGNVRNRTGGNRRILEEGKIVQDIDSPDEEGISSSPSVSIERGCLEKNSSAKNPRRGRARPT